MNLQKCENGHFYDAEKYQSCPHCQQLQDDVKTVGMWPTEPKNSEVFQSNDTPLSQMPTMPQNIYAPSDDQKTVSIFQSKLGGAQPVTGWLVCIKGSNFGQSYVLHDGKNFIGRGEDMDVCIRGDMAVARKIHASVIFEPKSSVFYAQPGESHELFYINDQVVLNSEVLKSHDVITLGETSLLFVPLCGPDFKWNDYKE